MIVQRGRCVCLPLHDVLQAWIGPEHGELLLLVDAAHLGERSISGAFQVFESSVDIAALGIGLGDQEIDAGALFGSADAGGDAGCAFARMSASSSMARAYSVMARSICLMPIHASARLRWAGALDSSSSSACFRYLTAFLYFLSR